MTNTYNSPTHSIAHSEEERNKYSIWISTEPYNSNGNNFVSIGSEASIGGSCNYGGSITGRLGRPPSYAIYADPSTGSVMEITISATRVNNVYFDNNVQFGYTNAEFEAIMNSLLTRTQFEQNAYVLRIFRADWSSGSNQTYTYHDIYVFIEDVNIDINAENPEVANVSLSLTRRNRARGFGDV